jgi:hypothetical protein
VLQQEETIMSISRRAVLSYAALLSLPTILIEAAAALAQPGPARVRQNIKQFAQDAQKVAALRAGVGKMKARTQADRDDPLGWYYWSACTAPRTLSPPLYRLSIGSANIPSSGKIRCSRCLSPNILSRGTARSPFSSKPR